MRTEYYIIDNPQPLSLDFASLKKEGLAYIQEHMNNDWTNLNPSDPGITILDQLCYALTELGYCNDFPMEDILTGSNDELQIKDQFYLPEDILTTSPVTINDLRKLIGDEVEGVDNLILITKKNVFGITGLYEIYLRISDKVTDTSDIQNICKAVFFLANKARNLGEIFLMPVPLTKVTRYLQGTININNETDLHSILLALQEAIDEYVFPKIISSGYERLTEKKSVEIDDIFNGPRLNNGWIPENELGSKLDKLRVAQLTQVILSVPGVLSATNLLFTEPDSTGSYSSASVAQTDILCIDIAGSTIAPSTLDSRMGLLKFFCKGKPLQIEQMMQSASAVYSSAQPNILFGAASVSQTTIPKGKYRDIGSYYSIQHTFPEIFRVGEAALTSNAEDFQVAQSRQLKGYLTLFDQVLANQFSQLECLGQLFSFKNATTGAPTDRDHFYAIQDDSALANPKYPVPFRSFSPTYFYQSVYNIPNVAPLLKNNNVFGFGYDPNQPEALLQYQSWIDYKNDPYNSYMKGLMDSMENEKVNLKRRNEILDHLLARHGESPVMIDALIAGSVYSGEHLKDAVIFKSLYLQNLGLLSYYRPKGHNYLGARRISAELPEKMESLSDTIPGWDMTDFIIDTEQIDRVERLGYQDFIDYSASELKLCLLFGMKAVYKNFLSSIDNNSDENKIARWLITQRRGFIFIESSLLNYYAASNDESGETSISLKPNELILLFPSFIPALTTPSFMKRLELFIHHEIPVRLKTRTYFADAATFSKIIPAFTDWHNCLIYHSPEHIFNKWLIKSSIGLIQIIQSMSPTTDV